MNKFIKFLNKFYLLQSFKIFDILLHKVIGELNGRVEVNALSSRDLSLHKKVGKGTIRSAEQNICVKL
jgi:hypothetical protein